MRISDWSSDVCSSDLLGDSIRPEMLDDLSERARHRRQCRQSLDHRIAAANGLAVDDRVAVVIAHRPRRKTALIVFARFVELDGEAVLEVIEHIRSEERRVGKECVSTCRYRWSPYH